MSEGENIKYDFSIISLENAVGFSFLSNIYFIFNFKCIYILFYYFHACFVSFKPSILSNKLTSIICGGSLSVE